MPRLWRRRIAHLIAPARRNPLPSVAKTGQDGAMDEVTIRAARPGDARSIARLDVETWRATYAGILSAPFLVGLSTQRREVGWASIIDRDPQDLRVAVDENGRIRGFGSCGRCRGQPEFAGEVYTLY